MCNQERWNHSRESISISRLSHLSARDVDLPCTILPAILPSHSPLFPTIVARGKISPGRRLRGGDPFGRELSPGAAFLRAELAELGLKLALVGVQRSWNSGCVGCWTLSWSRWRRGPCKLPKRRTCTRCSIARKRPVTSLPSVNASFPRLRRRARSSNKWIYFAVQV